MINQSYRFVWSAFVAIGLSTVLSFSTAKAIGGDHGAGNGVGNLAIPELGPDDGSDMFHKILKKYEYGSSQFNVEMVKQASYNHGITYYYEKRGNDELIPINSVGISDFTIGILDIDFGFQLLFDDEMMRGSDYSTDIEVLKNLKLRLQSSTIEPTLMNTGDWKIRWNEIRQTNDKHKFISIIRPNNNGCGGSAVPVDGICYITYYFKKVSLENIK